MQMDFTELYFEELEVGHSSALSPTLMFYCDRTSFLNATFLPHINGSTTKLGLPYKKNKPIE